MHSGEVSTWIAHVLMLLTTIIYALNYSVAKTIMPTPLDPSGLVFIRVFTATVFFFALYLTFGRERLALGDLPTIVGASLAGVVINTLLFFEGLALSDPIDASIIMALTPVLVFSFTLVSKMENVSFLGVFGALLAFVGIYSMITKFSFRLPDMTLGNLLLAINATSYALYIIFIKKMAKKYKPITLSFYTFFVALPFTAFFGLEEAISTNWGSLKASDWYAFLFVLIFVTILTYVFISYSSRALTASTVGFYNYLQPIFAIIIEVAIGSDQLSILDSLSIGLTLFGLYLVNFSRKHYVRRQKRPLSYSLKKARSLSHKV